MFESVFINLFALGKWRDHPVAVTTYSYMFGAIFMGLASLYFVITGQTSEFYIPLDVSTRTSLSTMFFSLCCVTTVCLVHIQKAVYKLQTRWQLIGV